MYISLSVYEETFRSFFQVPNDNNNNNNDKNHHNE